jgi:hypothetical protein
VRIKLADLGADAAMEDLFAITAFYEGFAFAAGGEAQGEEDAHERHEKTRKGGMTAEGRNDQ